MSRSAAFIVCVFGVVVGSMPGDARMRLEDSFVMHESPVRGKLFYLAEYPGTIYVADLQSKTNTPLLEAAYDGLQGNFDVSADGQKIVLALRHRDGWDIAWGHIRDGQRTSVEIVTGASDRDEDPRWVPGSERIVFKRNNGIAILDLGAGRVDELSPYEGQEKWAPAVSSDGQWVAVTEGHITESPSPSRLLLMNFFEGKQFAIATNQPLWFPAFKSNGDLLYVVHTLECDDEVYLMTLDQWRRSSVPKGKHLITLGSCSGSEADPSVVKGDDNYVLFVSQRTGRYNIYIYDQLRDRVALLLAHGSRDLLAPQLLANRDDVAELRTIPNANH